MMRLVKGTAVVALGALLLTGCSDTKGVSKSSAFPIGNGAAVTIPVAKRSEPVALSGTTLDGAKLDLASLRGKTVVLNVWGSWCAPCVKEAPDLVAAYDQLKPKNVAFVGINTRDDDDQARAFETAAKINYPSLVDPGNLLLSLRGAVPPNAIPTTLVIDPQGRVAARFSGRITTTTLVDLVSDATGGTA